jgi:hypothetical protein
MTCEFTLSFPFSLLDKMFENCKTYNRPDSKLYRDGVRLQKVMHSRLEELYEDADIVPPAAAGTAAAGGAATGATALEDLKKSPKDPKEPLR